MTQSTSDIRTSRKPLVFITVVILAALGLLIVTREDVPQDGTDLNTNTSVHNTNTPEPDSAQLAEFGFWIPSMKTPGILKESSQDEIHALGFGDDNMVITMPTDFEGMIRESYGVVNEAPITIDGEAGSRITGTSQKDGWSMDYIQVIHAGQLYVVRGTAEFLDEVQTHLVFKK